MRAYIINIMFKSGTTLQTAVKAIKAVQRTDKTGYTDVMWADVDEQTFNVLAVNHPQICKLDSLNVGQVEAITIINKY